mgnify:CR=1 FL=1
MIFQLENRILLLLAMSEQSFSEFLIKTLMLDKFERNFWGKEFIRFGALGTVCSNFYEYCALLGVQYSRNWKDFISVFNIPNEEFEELYSVSKNSIEKKLIPYAQDFTFFEVFCKLFENNDERFCPLSDRFNEVFNEKFPREVALELAAFNSLEGAFAGVIFPETIKQVYENGALKFKLMDKLNESTVNEWNIDIKQKFGVSDYEYPDFEKQLSYVNSLFLEYAEKNLPQELFDRFLLITYEGDFDSYDEENNDYADWLQDD